MKKIILILSLITPFFIFSQIENKETIYLLFDLNNKEKNILIEDGAGNSEKVNKYRKKYVGNVILFYIGEETFGFNKSKSKKDTCSINFLKYIKLADINYLTKKLIIEKLVKAFDSTKAFITSGALK